MLVLEAKMKGKVEQFEALDEALRTAQFIRNSCLRFWMDNDPAFPWLKSSTLRLDRLTQNGLGLRLRGSLITARSKFQARRAIPNLRSIKPVPALNIEPI